MDCRPLAPWFVFPSPPARHRVIVNAQTPSTRGCQHFRLKAIESSTVHLGLPSDTYTGGGAMDRTVLDDHLAALDEAIFGCSSPCACAVPLTADPRLDGPYLGFSVQHMRKPGMSSSTSTVEILRWPCRARYLYLRRPGAQLSPPPHDNEFDPDSSPIHPWSCPRLTVSLAALPFPSLPAIRLPLLFAISTKLPALARLNVQPHRRL